MEQKKPIKTRILQVLDQIRPAIQMDGGDIEFVKYDARKKCVMLRLLGACQGCPMSEITLYQGIEEALKSHLPEIREVVRVS